MNTEQKVGEGNGIILPTTTRKPTAINPRDMVIYGKPKSGKTTALSQLNNCLIIDVENGTAFIEGMIVSPPVGAGPITRFKWLKELAAAIKDADKPYDYVAIDTLSQLDADAEWVGTRNYMNSIAGKNFNRMTDEKGQLVRTADSKTIPLKSTDPNYESVLTLANGYGYRYTREAIMDMFETLRDLGKICTIFVSHVADKMIAEKGGEQVMIKDLALVGKTRDIIPRLCDAIANVWNEDGQMMISFEGNAEKIGGMRAKHLIGYNGPLDWNKIFIEAEDVETKSNNKNRKNS
jgi:hypothetical protein